MRPSRSASSVPPAFSSPASTLQLMVMEKASAAPSLASSANQAAFNLANAGGAWIGGIALAAGFGTTSPALAGALLAVLGLAVAATAYAVDRRRAEVSAAPGPPGRDPRPPHPEHAHH